MEQSDTEAAIKDSIRQQQAELVRGVSESSMADMGNNEVSPVADRITFPRAAGKDAEFICGCTTTIMPVESVADTLPPELATDSEKVHSMISKTLAELRANGNEPPKIGISGSPTLTYLRNRGYPLK